MAQLGVAGADEVEVEEPGEKKRAREDTRSGGVVSGRRRARKGSKGRAGGRTDPWSDRWMGKLETLAFRPLTGMDETQV